MGGSEYRFSIAPTLIFPLLASKLAAKTAMNRQYLVAGVGLPEVLGDHQSRSSGHRGG
jgi:hypothetical protein